MINEQIIDDNEANLNINDKASQQNPNIRKNL